jgi:hypothetical protein
MNKKAISAMIVLALALTMPVQVAIAQETIAGTISAIDSEALTVTIDETTLNVTWETAITVDGAEATLGDLVVGMSAISSYDPETMNAITIDATTVAE